MKDTIAEFQKSKEFLVCVDSDGCAMDTMNVKHEKCFGPKVVEIWGLANIEKRFLDVWNNVNLYTRTRGVNRFKGVVKTFEKLEEEGISMPDISAFKEWTETSNELSNPALEREIEKTRNEQLKKALSWSNAVNKSITELPEDDKPFENVKDGLSAINELCDIAIVSSANGSAVQNEWNRHELAQYVKVMLGQEVGTKAFCIDALKNNNYLNDKVLMVGDAPGDLEAALKNDVLYYPILVNKEAFSWERLANEAISKFIDGTFRGEYQQKLIDEFNSNLK